MNGDDDDHATRQTALPASSSPDDQPTGHVADVGIVAELRAVLTHGEKKTLPLYRLADQLVIGRGSACEWQLDDPSLSRKHAQLRWSGHELTVEDLGSANGTRVNGKPARTPTPAHPGEVIQLGTVMITLELRGGANPDEQSTRLVQTPESRPEAFPQLPGLATAIRPTQTAQPARAAAKQVFRPSKDYARADEPTRPWDPRAALVHAPDKAFDGEMMERLKEQWRTNRRPFVLAGAALWVGLLLGVWYLHDSMVQEEDAPPAVPHVAAPKVTSLDPPAAPAAAAAAAGAPLDGGVAETDRDAVLGEAVAAYDQGRLLEAMGLFKRLLPDEGARFMVELIQQRLGQP
jgi:pSer/pThr/pTyr-binding forkhead associated (FHA) protein